MRLVRILFIGSSLILPVFMAGVLSVSLSASSGTVEQSKTLRVGTYDTRAVALAYGRSARPDCLLAKVSDMRKEHAKAKQEGNQELVEKLEAQGPALQEKMHDQVFFGGPIDDILILIEDEMSEIAKKANVDVIVKGVLYNSSGVELIDISLQMVEPFQPDEETLEKIKKLIETPLIKKK